MKIRNVLVLAALALAPACGKGDPAEQMVTMMEDLGKAAEGAGGDCGKAGDAMNKVVDGYDLKAMKAAAAEADKDKAKAEEMKKKYMSRIMTAMGKLEPVMEKCKDDPKVKAVGDKLGDLR